MWNDEPGEKYPWHKCLDCEHFSAVRHTDLLVHQQNVHNAKYMGCSECGNAYIYDMRFKTHKENTPKCKAARLIEMDKLTAPGEKKFKCPDCGDFSANKNSKLLEHQRNIHCANYMGCSECGSAYILDQGFKAHKNERDTCKNAKLLEMNKLTAPNAERYKCPDCNRFSAKVKRELLIHRQNVHGADYMGCSECGNSYDTQQLFEFHVLKNDKCKKAKYFMLNKKANDAPATLICDMCDRRCDKKRLRAHRFTHFGKKVDSKIYQCKDCGNHFDAAEIETHVISQHNIFFFKCNACYKKFKTRDECETHLEYDEDCVELGGECKAINKTKDKEMFAIVGELAPDPSYINTENLSMFTGDNQSGQIAATQTTAEVTRRSSIKSRRNSNVPMHMGDHQSGQIDAEVPRSRSVKSRRNSLSSHRNTVSPPNYDAPTAIALSTTTSVSRRHTLKSSKKPSLKIASPHISTAKLGKNKTSSNRASSRRHAAPKVAAERTFSAAATRHKPNNPTQMSLPVRNAAANEDPMDIDMQHRNNAQDSAASSDFANPHTESTEVEYSFEADLMDTTNFQ